MTFLLNSFEHSFIVRSEQNLLKSAIKVKPISIETLGREIHLRNLTYATPFCQQLLPKFFG